MRRTARSMGSPPRGRIPSIDGEVYAFHGDAYRLDDSVAPTAPAVEVDMDTGAVRAADDSFFEMLIDDIPIAETHKIMMFDEVHTRLDNVATVAAAEIVALGYDDDVVPFVKELQALHEVTMMKSSEYYEYIRILKRAAAGEGAPLLEEDVNQKFAVLKALTEESERALANLKRNIDKYVSRHVSSSDDDMKEKRGGEDDLDLDSMFTGKKKTKKGRLTQAHRHRHHRPRHP